MGLFGCSKSVKKCLKQILANQQQLKEIIMTVKEDFADFKTAMESKLDNIQADVLKLQNLVVNQETPQEIKDGFAALLAKVSGIDDLEPNAPPVEPPPEEPL